MATATEKIQINSRMLNKQVYCLQRGEDGRTYGFYGTIEGIREDGETFIVRRGHLLIEVSMFDIRSLDE